MATMLVIDALDRCTIALPYIAEGQSDRLTIVLALLVERLEDAIGQAHAQVRQCTCAGTSQPWGASGAAPWGDSGETPRSPRDARFCDPRDPRYRSGRR